MKGLWCTLLLSLFLWSGGNTALGAGKINAYVSILPQAYFVERVGGDRVDVGVLVGPGRSPATYEPTPKQMAALGRSRVYFRIGTPFERGFMEKIASIHKDLEIVDTRKGVPLRYFRESGGKEVADPHIWLDPKRVGIQAATICEALSRLAPNHATEFEENLKAFRADLERVDRKIAGALAPVKGSRFYVFHPAFGYFGDSYGLVQVAVEIEGKEPSPKQLARLMGMAERDGVRVIFVQPQFARRNAEAIARAINGAVIPMNPLARDYLKNLEGMAEVLKGALRKR
jgi:zinc transport system substrate-binding protein